MAPKLIRPVDFDPDEDLRRIAELAEAWHGLFHPEDTAALPGAVRGPMELLSRARRMSLYLVTRPRRPVALAIIDGLDQSDAVELLALAPDTREPDVVRPLEGGAGWRRELARGAPGPARGRGVFGFLLGRPDGAALVDLEPEALVLAMARWGERNVLDPAPLVGQRLRALAGRLAESGGDENEPEP